MDDTLQYLEKHSENSRQRHVWDRDSKSLVRLKE